MKLRAVFVFAAALLLSGCQGPRYAWIVNTTGERLLLLRASPVGMPEINMANSSPWWWPFRTTPVLGGAQRLTSYGPFDGWEMQLQWPSGCKMVFVVPAEPLDAYEREDWRIYTAYRQTVVQLDADRRLYRVPAYSAESAADVSLLAQPEGYPLAPTESDC